MAWEKVAAGQKLRQTPIHRAGYINDTVDVVNAHKEGRLQGPSSSPQGSQSRVQVEVRNLTGTNLALGQVVQLGAHLLTDVNEEHPWFEGNLVANPVADRFAILTRPLPPGEIGPAQIAGVCLAHVFVFDPQADCCLSCRVRKSSAMLNTGSGWCESSDSPRGRYP